MAVMGLIEGAARPHWLVALSIAARLSAAHHREFAGPGSVYLRRRALIEAEAEEIEQALDAAATPELLEAARAFVDKVDAGFARSRDSYARFKAAIAKAEGR